MPWTHALAGDSPLFGLRVRCVDIELRVPDEDRGLASCLALFGADD